MPELDIDTQRLNGDVLVRLSGEADLPSIPTIERVLRPLLERGTRVVVDIANLEFCSYSFLSALDRLRTELSAGGGNLLVGGATNWLREVLQKIGMTSILLPGTATATDAEQAEGRISSGSG